MLEDGVVDRRSVLRFGLATAALAGSGSLLAGCGGTTDSPGTAASAKGTKAALPSYVPFPGGVKPDMPGTPDGVADAYLKYPSDPVKVTDGTPPGDGSDVSAFVETFSPIVPGVDRNSYWQQLNSDLGVNLKMSVVPAGDYTNKFATIIAGNELPDFLQIVATPPGMTQLLSAKCQDLAPFLSGDAIKEYPFLAAIPEIFWSTCCMYNGGIYGLPVPRFKMSNALFRRDDILTDLGLDPDPKSWAEFAKLCKDVTDPKRNRWALTDAEGALIFAQQSLGVGNVWSAEGGKLTSYYEEEGTKQALDAIAQLVKAGLVHPDGFSAVSADIKLNFNTGKGVMSQDGITAWPQYYVQNVAGPKFKVGAFVPPPYDITISDAATWQRLPSFSLTALKKADDERIQMLLRVANWMASPFGSQEYLFRTYGVKDVHWKLDDNGQPVTTDKGNAEVPGLGLMYVTNCPAVLYSPGRDVATRDCYDYETKVVPTSKQNAVLGFYSDTFSRKGAQLDTKMLDAQAAIMKGDAPLSSWDDAVAGWKSDGGDKIRAEYEEAIQTAG